jgi:hypothetical protein
MTSDDEAAFFAAKDVDGNGVGDNKDCGLFICAAQPPPYAPGTGHRIDIKPSFPFPKTINPGTEATITIAIFSETNGSSVWDAPTRVVTLTNGCTASTPPCLTFRVENVVEPLKTNQNGQGTCSVQNVADPITGQSDGIKDFKCQFSTSGLPTGTHFGVVSGYFFKDPTCIDLLNPLCAVSAFSARQEVTILP